jgi:putative hydrolase of HD superfamily
MEKKMNVIKNVVNFLFEMGKLEYTPRSGWQYLGIRDPESVGEHTAGAAQIAFVLAIMEGHKNPCHCATLALWHDVDEVRILDQNRVSKGYNKTNHDQAMHDQVFGLGNVGDGVTVVRNEFEEGKTKGSIIAQDADVLQMIRKARELVVRGYSDAQEWIDSNIPRLQTKSAQLLAEEIRNADPNAWWKNFKTRDSFSETVGL